MRCVLVLLALVTVPDVVVAQEDAPPLHAAIRAGDLTEAERLLEAGADPSELDDDGRSPLVDALAYGHEALALRLLEAGADPSVGQSRGRSPIIIAVTKGYPAVVAALLSAGADPNATADRGETALHIAASFDSDQHAATLRELIQAGADVDARDEDGRSPLHEAASDLNVQTFQLLLDAGAPLAPDIAGVVAGKYEDPGRSDGSARRERRMQMLAQFIGTAEERLAEEDFMAMIVDVVQSAVKGGNAYVLEEYLRPGSVQTVPVFQTEAVMVGLQEALRSAIAYSSMASGATALEDVASNAEEAVRILLNAGVPPDAADETGWTPLMSAVLAGEVGIVRALLEAGADPEHTRVYRGQEQTPIGLAEEEGETDILELLRAARDGKLSSVTTTCNDVRCFEEAFRACEESVVFSADEPGLNARVEYEIIGSIVGEGVSGCEVSMVYRENPNPEWVGKPVQLTLDPQRSFMEEITQGLQQCVDGTPGRYACEGPLLEVMRQ